MASDKRSLVVRDHLNPRFEHRVLNVLSADDMANLVRELRAEGKREATISVILNVVGHVYRHASRRLGWTGTVPTALLTRAERPKVSQSKRRPIFMGEQLEQTIAAAYEPSRTLFILAALTGARVSELCGLTWADVRIDRPGDAEIEFVFQVDHTEPDGRSKPTDQLGPSLSQISSRRSFNITRAVLGSGPTRASSLRLVLVDRCSSGMSRGRCAKPRSGRSTQAVGRRSRAVFPGRCRAARDASRAHAASPSPATAALA